MAEIVGPADHYFIFAVAFEVEAQDLCDLHFRAANAFRGQEFADGFNVFGLGDVLRFRDAGKRVPFPGDSQRALVGRLGFQRDTERFRARLVR